MIKTNFKISDFLVLNLSKEIRENETLVQGTSTFIPMIATALAMQSRKINFLGGFFLNPSLTPKTPSTFCFENYKDWREHMGLSEFLDMLQKGKIDLEFLRPAQVDKYGNMNNTVIGDYNNPKVRLPGGMGIDDVMHFSKKIILYIPDHNERVFVDKVDFVTASGWDKGKGPDKIITNMCVFEFIDKKITLTKINPAYSIEDIQKNTGFKFGMAKDIKKMLLVDDKTKKLITRLDPLELRNLEIKGEREKVMKKFS